MKTRKSNLQYRLLLLILTCYFLPLISLISYNIFLENFHEDWSLLSFGLFLTSIGTLILFWKLSKSESTSEFLENANVNKNEKKLSPDENEFENYADLDSRQNKLDVDLQEFNFLKLSLDEAQQMQIRLLAEIDTIVAELKETKNEKANLLKSHETLVSDIENERSLFNKQLEEQQTHITNLHRSIAEQKAFLEKKELHSSSLESKVGDLTYEIKTLLQLAEAHNSSLFSDTNDAPHQNNSQHNLETSQSKPPKPIEIKQDNTNEGSHHLKKCITIAQKITGSQRFGSQLYSSIDSPVESFAIDLRRLCDRLRMEIVSTNCTVLLYSPRDSELLFAGNQIRDLTGWSPEKFTQTFNEVLQDENSFRSGISSLSMRSEAVIPLGIKTKSGQLATFQTHLGMIPTGIFRNHVIALLVH